MSRLYNILDELVNDKELKAFITTYENHDALDDRLRLDIINEGEVTYVFLMTSISEYTRIRVIKYDFTSATMKRIIIQKLLSTLNIANSANKRELNE